MEIKNLKNTSIATIVECLITSFSDYFVKMTDDLNYWEQRWKGARVDYELSYGMFEGEKLVGFIIQGVDEEDGELIAFNTGTGVIPEFRGQKITQKIYQEIIPILKEKGFSKCRLEVIQDNDKAIHVYENIGFKKVKNYLCFKGEMHIDESFKIELKKVKYEDVNWDEVPNQEHYSWDHTKEALHAGKANYGFYKVLYVGKEIGFFALNIHNGLVAQLELLTEKEEDWAKVLQGLEEVNATVKINNIDHSLEEKIDAIKDTGLKNEINQYEMEMEL